MCVAFTVRSVTSNIALWFPSRTRVGIMLNTSANQQGCDFFSLKKNSKTDSNRKSFSLTLWGFVPQQLLGRAGLLFTRFCLRTENTWSWLEAEFSDVLPAIYQINCTYIDIMGLEWGYGVEDINLGWKSAITLVCPHLTGSPWPAGRGDQSCHDLY